MNWLDYLIAGLALAGLAVTSWWGVYQSPNKAANLQAELEHAANAALAADGLVWASARMRGQHALILGQAPSKDEVDAAADAVLRSSGPGGLLMGGVTQVENAASVAPPRADYTWSARKSADGVIVLSGEVPSQSIAEQLREDAGGVGGDTVDDKMSVAGGAPGNNWQGTARFALSQLAHLQEGEARLTGTDLVLTGHTPDPAARQQVKAQTRSLVAPYSGRAVISGQVRWSAEISDGELRLQGAVASESVRSRILRGAEAEFDGQIIDAQQVEAAFQADDMAVLTLAMTHFPRFSEGLFFMDEHGFALIGRADHQTAEALQTALRDQLSDDRTLLEIVGPAQP